MSLDQVLLLTLAAPATYLLLYVLLRLENLLPDAAPPADATPGRHVLAAASVPAAVPATPGDGGTGDQAAAWTIPLPATDRAA
jgi:hypothetical protein